MNFISIGAVIVFYWFAFKFLRFVFRKFMKVRNDVNLTRTKLGKIFNSQAVEKTENLKPADTKLSKLDIEQVFSKFVVFILISTKFLASGIVNTWKFIAQIDYARCGQWFIIRKKHFDAWYSGKGH